MRYRQIRNLRNTNESNDSTTIVYLINRSVSFVGLSNRIRGNSFLISGPVVKGQVEFETNGWYLFLNLAGKAVVARHFEAEFPETLTVLGFRSLHKALDALNWS